MYDSQVFFTYQLAVITIAYKMKIHIIAVGNKFPNWINDAFNEYIKRFPQEIGIHLTEIKPEKRTSSKSTEQIHKLESQRIKSALSTRYRIIALDETGKQWTTSQLAETLKKWMQTGHDTAFVIGGADGLHESIKQSADTILSLSKLTFPHGLARVILIEQLYRALSIIKNHPYHRI